MQSLKCIVEARCLGRGFSVTKLNIIRNFSGKIDSEGETNNSEVDGDKKVGSFAKAFEKFSQPEPEKQPEAPQSFAKLLRNSKFVDVSFSIYFFLFRWTNIYKLINFYCSWVIQRVKL